MSLDNSKKNNNNIKLIVFCVLAGLILALSSAIRTVYGSRTAVVYEHDKLYQEFKKSYNITGETPQTTENKERIILTENDNFSVGYVYTDEQECTLSIKNKNTEQFYWGPYEIYGIDPDGKEVVTYSVCCGEKYYNPYTQEFEHGLRFTEISEDKVVIEVLLLQEFFLENKDLRYARFMTVEDYEDFIKNLPTEISENSKDFWNKAYRLTTSEEMNFADKELLFGEDGNGTPGIDMNKFSQPFYLGKNFSVRTDKYIEEAKYTIDSVRLYESKFIKKGYEAPMALARVSIDISGDDLKYEKELVKIISPQKSDVVDIKIPERISEG